MLRRTWYNHVFFTPLRCNVNYNKEESSFCILCFDDKSLAVPHTDVDSYFFYFISKLNYVCVISDIYLKDHPCVDLPSMCVFFVASCYTCMLC